MFDSLEAIRDQLQAGEDSCAEFKEVRCGKQRVRAPNAEEVAAEMVAFANAEGGAIFLGVSDAGAVVGMPHADLRTVEAWIINLASHNCDPPLRPLVRSVVLRGPGGEAQHVLMVEISKGLYVHRT